MSTEICAESFVNSKGPAIPLGVVFNKTSHSFSHAIAVMIAPVVAPAAAKHVTVPSVGVLPGLLTTTSGSSPPVACPMTEENLYLAF